MVATQRGDPARNRFAADARVRDTFALARQTAGKALALDPQHAGALAVSARLAADSGDHLREAALIARALELEPNNANTWLWKGLGEYETGHVRAAHACFVQAQRLDPLSGLHVGWLAITSPSGRDDALAMLEQAHALGWRGPASRALFLRALASGNDPGERYLAWLDDDDAMPQVQRDVARTLATGLGDPQQREAMQRLLLDAIALHPEFDWAVLLQVFGLTDEAMQAALRTTAIDAQGLRLNLWFPAFDSFRAHPRFIEFAEREGLVTYWRQFGPPDGCRLDSNSATPMLTCAR